MWNGANRNGAMRNEKLNLLDESAGNADLLACLLATYESYGARDPLVDCANPDSGAGDNASRDSGAGDSGNRSRDDGEE